MKKIATLFILMLVFIACNSNEDNDLSDDYDNVIVPHLKIDSYNLKAGASLSIPQNYISEERVDEKVFMSNILFDINGLKISDRFEIVKVIISSNSEIWSSENLTISEDDDHHSEMIDYLFEINNNMNKDFFVANRLEFHNNGVIFWDALNIDLLLGANGDNRNLIEAGLIIIYELIDKDSNKKHLIKVSKASLGFIY